MTDKQSWLSKVFGGKKGAPPDTQTAIQKLRETEEMLEKKTAFLEGKIQTELEIAKKNGTRNKRAALMALKRKKKYEKQLQQIDGTLSTIEFQREALESAGTNTEVLKAMEYAAKALKGAHASMDVDQVHDIMDEVAEQHEVADEIANAISNPVGFNNDLDEDELEAELEELEQEALDEKMLDIGAPSASVDVELPSVPTGEPRAAESSKGRSKEDEELAELSAWAS